MKFLTVFLILLFSNHTQAQDSRDSVIKAFFVSYQELNFDKMVSYYNENVTFNDPTTVIFGQPVSLKSVDAIRSYFTENMKGSFFNTEITIERMFHVSNISVVTLNFKSQVSSKNFGGSAENKVQISIPMTTIFTFDSNNKVLSHTDYADYSEYMNQAREQIQN